MTLDLAGEDEAVIADPENLAEKDLSNPKRDSTALTVFEVDLDTINDPLINKPTYRVVFRKEWIGIKHSTLYGEIKAIAELFEIRFLVVDATGVGAGMSSFLAASLGDRVIPFELISPLKAPCCGTFSGSSIPEGLSPKESTGTFWEQVEFCQFEILPGPQKRVKWGVPDGTRNPAPRELVHDDQLISAALVAVLDAGLGLLRPHFRNSCRGSTRRYG